jgi:oligogalacturonide lyase
VLARLCLISIGLFAAATVRPAALPRDLGCERRDYADPVTGVTVTELTGPERPADNLYFHFSNFTADNRHVLLIATVDGVRSLCRVEVESGRLVQLTAAPAFNPASACPDPADARRVYLLRGAEVWALDVDTAAARRVGEIPPPHIGGFTQLSPGGDGRRLAVGKQRDAANWEIGLLDTQTGAYRTVLTQGFRIGHVQLHPSAPVIFYVWETGGYAPQRTWLVNTDGTGNRPFYARTDPAQWFTPLKEWVTHEAWVAGTGEMTMVNDKLGLMLVNLAGEARLVREGRYWHAAASPDGARLVADDFEGRLWLITTATGEARLLATGLRDTVRVHPHPSFDRHGHFVQFHSGRRHETVALIDLRTLPPR